MTSPCSLCSAECCKTYTITVTSFDILRICENTAKKAEEFAVLHPARLLCYDPDLILETKGGGSYLLGICSHPCIFIEKNKCAVYPFAPLSCRKYPYRTDGSFNARFCPFIPKVLLRLKGQDISKDELLSELNAYKKIVNEWNKKPGRKKDCVVFLLEKSRGR